MIAIKRVVPGILFCVLLAIPAWTIGNMVPVIGSPVLALLFGMIAVIIFPSILMQKFESGLKFTSKKLLQYAIILLGFEMNLFNIIDVGGQSFFIMLFTLSASFITAFFIGKKLKIERKMNILIGVGTSICGGSAIAATAPVIDAKDEDVAHAMSTIFLFNIIAALIFPALGHMLGMSDIGFGIWAGTAINDTSSVMAAATTWSISADNNNALAFATIVKLTRTLMIVPITLILAIYTTYKEREVINSNSTNKFNFVKVFPWFIICFVATSFINTFIEMPSIFCGIGTIGKFMIVIAMVAIGLNINLKKLITNGLKPILLGLSCWFVIASVSLLVQKLIGTW